MHHANIECIDATETDIAVTAVTSLPKSLLDTLLDIPTMLLFL